MSTRKRTTNPAVEMQPVDKSWDDAVDWAETVEWVKPDPDDIGAVGIARVHADTIIHQAVSALISAGLLRVAGPTEQDGGA